MHRCQVYGGVKDVRKEVLSVAYSPSVENLILTGGGDSVSRLDLDNLFDQWLSIIHRRLLYMTCVTLDSIRQLAKPVVPLLPTNCIRSTLTLMRCFILSGHRTSLPSLLPVPLIDESISGTCLK
jgi:hypothetical protein